MKKKLVNNYDSKRKAIRVFPHNELSSHELSSHEISSQEQNLVKWVHIMRENRISLSGPMVQEKAMEFSKAIKVTNFVPSNGWPDPFKKREALD